MCVNHLCECESILSCQEVLVCFPVSTFSLELKLMMIHKNEWKLFRPQPAARPGESGELRQNLHSTEVLDVKLVLCEM